MSAVEIVATLAHDLIGPFVYAPSNSCSLAEPLAFRPEVVVVRIFLFTVVRFVPFEVLHLLLLHWLCAMCC